MPNEQYRGMQTSVGIAQHYLQQIKNSASTPYINPVKTCGTLMYMALYSELARTCLPGPALCQPPEVSTINVIPYWTMPWPFSSSNSFEVTVYYL